MKQEVEKLYLEFFDYYQGVKDFVNILYQESPNVNILFNDIISNIYYYYENKDDTVFNEEVVSYFENEEILTEIIFKVKKIIELVKNVYIEVCNLDSEMFNQYCELLYNISFLEDLLIYLESNNIEKDKYEQELNELKHILYNKEEITNEFNEYLKNRIEKITNEQESFCASIFIFEYLKAALFDENIFSDNKDNYIQEIVNEFLNNMGSFYELSRMIKQTDTKLYNKILKLENVILKLQYARQSAENLFGDNNENIINSFLIELIHLYNVWLIELDRVFDLYGIEYVVKYKDLIYYASIIKDIIEFFGDININDENLGDYFLALYKSILDNNMDDFEQFVLYGEDLVDQLCERFELVVNKLEEQIEFLYTLFTKNN